jgi:hypothetical protein
MPLDTVPPPVSSVRACFTSPRLLPMSEMMPPMYLLGAAK